MSAPGTIRVLIADQDGLARRMLRAALSESGGIAVLPSASNAREMLELIRYYRPGVLIVDTLSFDGDGQLIRGALAASPETVILTISAEQDDDTVLAGLRAGSAGHLSKDLEPDQLASLVRRAADGEAIVPRRLTTPLLGMVHELPEAGWRPLHSCLTTREWEIVELLSEGASTERIADLLVLSTATVYSHVKSVSRKLGVNTRGDAVAAAFRLRREEVLGTNVPADG